ncbi:MAG: F0F1 ATP synthase subunit A [Gemmataceae bacterium]
MTQDQQIDEHQRTGRWSVPLAVGLALMGMTVPLAWGAPPLPHDSAAETTPHAEHHDAKKHAEKKVDPFEHVDDWGEWHGPMHTYIPLPKIRVFGITLLQVTKYMILQLVAAGLIIAIYVPLARRLRTGEPPRGRWDNTFEVLLTFIRDQVARPNIGEHDADKYVPFLWTLFLYVLFCNLLGMIPLAGSPTASIYVTGGLALVAFFAIHGAAIAKMGFVHYFESQWPHMDIPFGMGYVIKPLIFGIEMVGHVLKCFVLAVRLFANMLAGHTVLSMILLFIVMAGNTGFGLWASITFASVLGVVALSLLELFVAFLQAYIFVFLTSLFMGMTLHPEH